MKKATKILLALVSLVLMLTLVAGCGNGDDAPEATPTPTPAPGAEVAPPADDDPDDDVVEDLFPQYAHIGRGFVNSIGMVQVARHTNPFEYEVRDMGGRVVRIGSGWSGFFTPADPIEATHPDHMVRWRALESIQEDFNVTFDIYNMASIGFHNQDLAERLALYRTAGDVFLDWVDYQTNMNPGTAIFNFLYPVEQIGPLARQQPGAFNLWVYYPNSLYFAGHNFQVSNEPPWMDVRDLLLFNQDIMDRFGIGCLYTMVRNNEWTHDRFFEIVSTIWDQSGGEILAMTKRWTWVCIYDRFMASNEAVPFVMQDGLMVTNFGTENALRALTTVYEMTSRGMVDFYQWDFHVFRDGHAAFMMIDGWQVAYDGGTAYEHGMNVGILPFPMGPDSTSYQSLFDTVRAWAFVDNGTSKDDVGELFVAWMSRMYDFWPEIHEEHESQWILEDTFLDNGFTQNDIEMAGIIMSRLQMNKRNMIPTTWPVSDAMWQLRNHYATPREAIDQMLPAMQAILDDFNAGN